MGSTWRPGHQWGLGVIQVMKGRAVISGCKSEVQGEAGCNMLSEDEAPMRLTGLHLGSGGPRAVSSSWKGMDVWSHRAHEHVAYMVMHGNTWGSHGEPGHQWG